MTAIEIIMGILEQAVQLAAKLGATEEDIATVCARAVASQDVITSALAEDRLADKEAADGK